MTPDLFPETRLPRAKARVLMHVNDAGDAGDGKPLCEMKCTRCAFVSGWLVFDTITESKRGIPCPKCNPADVMGEYSQLFTDDKNEH